MICQENFKQIYKITSYSHYSIVSLNLFKGIEIGVRDCFFFFNNCVCEYASVFNITSITEIIELSCHQLLFLIGIY